MQNEKECTYISYKLSLNQCQSIFRFLGVSHTCLLHCDLGKAEQTHTYTVADVSLSVCLSVCLYLCIYAGMLYPTATSHVSVQTVKHIYFMLTEAVGCTAVHWLSFSIALTRC